MNDLPRAILKDMIRRYGSSLAQDPVRCEGILRDSCSKCHREIFVLVNASRQRIPADLTAPRLALPLSLMKGFLAKRLQDELGFSDEASRWAVESWADALGVTDHGAPEQEVREPVLPRDRCDVVIPGRCSFRGDRPVHTLGRRSQNRIAFFTARCRRRAFMHPGPIFRP